MTRMQRAVQYAKDTLIAHQPLWADKEFRIYQWEQAHQIEKLVWMDQMCRLANEQLETPEIIEAKDV